MAGQGEPGAGLIAGRSVAFGLVTISITALAHAAAGGRLPSVPGAVVLVLATSATAWPVLRRDVRPTVLFAAVGVAQLALHPAFQALAGPAAHAGHQAGSGPMVLAHVAAGLAAVALVLAVDPLVRRLGAARRAGRPRVLATGSHAVPAGPPIHLVPARVLTDAPRRGPPDRPIDRLHRRSAPVRPATAGPDPACPAGARPAVRRATRSPCPPALRVRREPAGFPFPDQEFFVSKSLLRSAARAAVVAAGVGALTLGGALAANAHVSVIPDTTAAGSYALLTFGVPHGCDGSSTTKVAIKIPEQVNAVTPTVNPNWDVQKVMVPLNPAVTDSHGNQITERVDQVVYTAKTPLPDGYRDAFVLSLKVPDVAGQTLSFPTIQTCEVGETAWIEPTVEGQDEPDHPAPAFEVTAAAAGGDDDHAASATTAAAAATAAPTSGAEVATASSDSTTASSTPGWVAVAGLVAGVLGLIVGGVALARSRRA